MSPRAYTMRARADAAEATRQRIVDAAADLLQERIRSDIRLQDVAARAGVSVQTVLRAHENRATLLDRAMARMLERIATELRGAEPGDIAGSVHAWFDHYERMGDAVITALAAEDDPAVAPTVALGRRLHRGHVERQFGPQLANVPATDRREVVDALVCATDVYTWKLLRRDLKRSRTSAEATVVRLVRSMIGGR